MRANLAFSRLWEHYIAEFKMLTITDGGSLAGALKLPIDSHLKQLLIERRDQFGGDITNIARFIVVQRGDSMTALEEKLGWSVFVTPEGQRFGKPSFYPGFEWLADHGHCFEMVFILTDDGFAHVVIIEQSVGVDPDLLKLCKMYVTDRI